MSAPFISAGPKIFDYSNEQDAVAVWELLLSAARVSGISLGRGHPADERDIREIIDHEKCPQRKQKLRQLTAIDAKPAEHPRSGRRSARER